MYTYIYIYIHVFQHSINDKIYDYPLGHVILIIFLVIPPASTKLKGGYTGITLSVCPSVDRIVSALYLQQYSSDPFHICTSYQATSEGVSRVMRVSYVWNFGDFFLICNFDFVFFWLVVFGQFPPLPLPSTVQDGFFPYLVQMINSMRGCVACDDLWPWPISSRSFGLDLKIVSAL